MSTRNLQGLDALAAANKLVAESARDRGRELEQEAEANRRQHEQSLDDADIARRALEQRHNDRMDVLNEEAGQLAYILRGTRQVEQASAPAPAEPAVEPPAAPHGRHVSQPAETPAVVADAAGVQAEPTSRQRISLAWLFALIVGLLVLIFMSNFYDELLGWAQGDLNWGTNGFVQFVVIVGPAVVASYWTWIVSKRKNL